MAAITGYALGGGCELALCADVRFAAEDAAIGQPEILLGVIPGAGGTQRLTRLVGPSRAKDIIFTGRFVKAEEALAIGLVDRVIPADQVYDEALAWARQFDHAATYAVRAAKEAIDQGLEVDLDTGLAIERQQFAGAVRHRGPPDRDDVVRREWSREGGVRGPLSGPKGFRDTFANQAQAPASGGWDVPSFRRGHSGATDRGVLTGVAR